MSAPTGGFTAWVSTHRDDAPTHAVAMVAVIALLGLMVQLRWRVRRSRFCTRHCQVRVSTATAAARGGSCLRSAAAGVADLLGCFVVRQAPYGALGYGVRSLTQGSAKAAATPVVTLSELLGDAPGDAQGNDHPQLRRVWPGQLVADPVTAAVLRGEEPPAAPPSTTGKSGRVARRNAKKKPRTGKRGASADTRRSQSAGLDEEQDAPARRRQEAFRATRGGASPGAQAMADAAAAAGVPAEAVRVVTWNVERGQQMAALAEELTLLDADVLLLQELDHGCSRTCGVSVVAELAAEMGDDWHFVWACEFVELCAPERTKDEGEGEGGGCHGNAILSRLPISAAWALQHSPAFDWERYGGELGETRCGTRVTVGATVETPTGQLLVYTVHMENFCGPSGRYSQFAEVLADAHERRRAGDSAPDAALIVAGDLNTLSTGAAALLPTYNDAAFPYGSGVLSGHHSEAARWRRKLLSRSDSLVPSSMRGVWRPCGLEDPFDDADATVRHGSWQAKLDWLLLESDLLEVHCHGKGGEGRSDHMWLAADVTVTER